MKDTLDELKERVAHVEGAELEDNYMTVSVHYRAVRGVGRSVWLGARVVVMVTVLLVAVTQRTVTWYLLVGAAPVLHLQVEAGKVKDVEEVIDTCVQRV